MSLLNLNIVVV